MKMTRDDECPVQVQSLSWKDLDKQKFYIVGPSLFLGVRALVYPSNVVKTRLQVQHRLSSYHYTGTVDAFRQIIRSEGPRGLYKGFGANAFGIVTGNLYITVYEKTRQTYLDAGIIHPDMVNFISGALASMVSQTVVVPLDIVSQNMMLEGIRASSTTTPSVFHTCRSIHARAGIRGFYRGFLPSLATYAPSSSIWWGSYGLVLPVVVDTNLSNNHVVAQAVAGGIAGVLAAIVTNPMDVLRTRCQVSRRDVSVLVRELWQTPQTCMSGVSARMLAMGQSGMLVISTYELVKRLSRVESREHPSP